MMLSKSSQLWTALWPADSEFITALFGTSWIMGSHAMNQILVSTHAPNFRIKMVLFWNFPLYHSRSHWYAFLLETETTTLVPLVLFHHFMFSVVHKLHGHAIPLLSSHIPRLHGCTISPWMSGLNPSDEHKYGPTPPENLKFQPCPLYLYLFERF
jgi:hypothetical protein